MRRTITAGALRYCTHGAANEAEIWRASYPGDNAALFLFGHLDAPFCVADFALQRRAAARPHRLHGFAHFLWIRLLARSPTFPQAIDFNDNYFVE
jgi:hypothetical protein